MNIIKTERVTVTYNARCSVCDAAGPSSHTRQFANEVASQEGWMVETTFNGLCWISSTRCPLCCVDHEDKKCS